MKPRILDLFCCQGGASAGYVAAGFEVLGIDIDEQSRYPFSFVRRDALEFLADMIVRGHDFAAIHASPPCQAHTKAQRIRAREHPDLIEPIRELLIFSGLPYVIENVPDAPLRDPVELCGSMFGLHTYRHRLFESNIPLVVPDHPEHQWQTVKMGRPLKSGDWYHAVGNFSNIPYVRADMGASWMSRDGLRESIPPIYAEFVGRQLIEVID